MKPYFCMRFLIKYLFQKIFMDLHVKLNNWQNTTNDPWICAPNGVLEAAGHYKLHPTCMSADYFKDEF